MAFELIKARQIVAEEMFEAIMAENFPNLVTGTKPPFQKAQRTRCDKYQIWTEAYCIQTAGNQRKDRES